MTETGIDYQNQPLYDAWWTPGWTAQNDAYNAVPANVYASPGYPSTATQMIVTGNFFDFDGSPLSGYFTFWPSSPVTFNVAGVITEMPQRYCGYNLSLLGMNQMGDGKIHLDHGRLAVQLLATDCPGTTPSSFTYHVKEHFFEGNEYDITVSHLNPSPVDIHDLILTGVTSEDTIQSPVMNAIGMS